MHTDDIHSEKTLDETDCNGFSRSALMKLFSYHIPYF